MTKTEHLQRIRARCEELIGAYLFEHEPDARVAGWRATIAAIDGLHRLINLGEGTVDYDIACQTRDSIIATWPEELL